MNMKSSRADFASPGEPLDASQFLNTPSKEVINTMTKMIEGNE